jgi:hypothetical protein
MRVNRRLLYWGVFLVAIGGVLVAADVRAIDAQAIVNTLQLWPLAFVAIGVGIVVRRTRFSVPGGMLAAAIPGLLFGGGLALIPRFTEDCGAGSTPANVATREGTFDGPARITVVTGCGRIVIDTASGNGWQLEAANTASRTPVIEATARSLSIDAGGNGGWHTRFGFDDDEGWEGFEMGRDTWRLTLPTAAIEDLAVDVNAAQGDINLPGANIGHLDIATNAGETTADLSEATVVSLSGTVNAGMLSIRLPSGHDLTGSIEVSAGQLQVCSLPDLGLRIHRAGTLSGISVDGFKEPGTDWESPGYTSATYHADLDIEVNLGNVEINPIGGCK